MNLPIRIRMTAWYLTLLVLVLVAVGAFVVLQLRSDLIDGIDAGLRPAAAQVAHDYQAEGAAELRDSANQVVKGERPLAQLLGEDGAVVTSTGDAAARRPLLDAGQIATVLRGRTLIADHGDFRVVARAVRRAGVPGVVVVGQSTDPVDRSVGRVLTLLLLAVPVALVAIAAGGWWLAGRSLRPVGRMADTAAAIGVDRLHERVPEPAARDELAHLAETLNTMLARIESGVVEQRRLVADASHELRSPLAAMRAEIDVSLRTDRLDAPAREVLISTREEVDRMSRTVDDLLTLAAVDDGALVLNVEPADLGDIARDVVAALRPLAQRRGVDVRVHSAGAPVRGDRAGLARAVRNVVENAIEFSPEGGTVTVTAAHGRLVVEDDGPGIPAPLRDRVFDRFYRVDPSRTRATGGSGLGLAITREIVVAHGGRVHAGAREGNGTAMVVQLGD